MSYLPPTVYHWRVPDVAPVAFVHLRRLADAVELEPVARQGTLTSAWLPLSVPATEVIASWQGRTPDDARLEVAVRAEFAEAAGPRVTRWWQLGIWSEQSAIRRSVADQQDADGSVATDVLQLAQPASRLQWRVTFQRSSRGSTPSLHGLTLSTSPVPPTPALDVPDVEPLAVPSMPQLIYPGRAIWCSPASLAMVLAYWANQTNDLRWQPFRQPSSIHRVIGPSVYDPVYSGTGNWAFNTAFAASLGLEAYVVRFGALHELVPWISAGVPLIVSLRWEPGELAGAPIANSPGHLLVVAGFVAGKVVVNDPITRMASGYMVRRSYRAEQFEQTWINGSKRMAYIIHPPGWLISTTNVPIAATSEVLD